jgi:hypothetical protein
MGDDSKQIEELKAELDKLKTSIAPPPYDREDEARWRDQMHQLRERRASAHLPFTRSQLAAMDAACSRADIKDLVAHNTLPSRSAAGASGQLVKTSTGPGIPGSNTSGWQAPTPLGPPPGIGYVDRLCEVDSARQRGERMVTEARIKAAEKSE